MVRTDTQSRRSVPPTDEPDGGVRGFRARFRALPGGWVAWRVGVTILGVAVIVGGVILLPLPGPGWLIIFAGLGLLATEYVWASRLLAYGRDTLRRWTAWLKRQPLWVRGAVALGTFAIVVAAVWLAWLLLY
jgi:uncharacterized protein (TIGR02611 family)